MLAVYKKNITGEINLHYSRGSRGLFQLLDTVKSLVSVS